MKKTNFLLIALIMLVFPAFSTNYYYSQSEIDILKQLDAACDVTNVLTWGTAVGAPTVMTSKPTGLTLNGNGTSTAPGRIKGISISTKGLVGVLNFQGIDTLKTLTCSNNFITGLDVTKNSVLSSLKCAGDSLLISLDVSSNTLLTDLYLSYCKRTDINVSTNVNLNNLDCSHNLLTNLDVANNTQLWMLNCSYNGLNSLDLSTIYYCGEVFCSDNNLKKLNVRTIAGEYGLTALDCSNNQIDSLDLSLNDYLDDVNCSGNSNLVYLNLSNNPILKTLDCSYSGLTSLDFSALAALTTLDCQGNFLTFRSLATLKATPATSFAYGNQQDITETKSYKVNDVIDYSSEAGTYDGNATEFKFYRDNNAVDTTCVATNTTGLYTATSDGNYFCTLINAKFPDLTVKIVDIKVNTATDVKQENQLSNENVSVYPNPVTDKLYIKDVNLVKNIKVYSNDGKLLISTNDFANGIDLSSYNTGIYIVKVEKEGKIQTAKIVKK